MKLFPQEENYFGLDIGSTSIKLVQLRELHAQPSLVTYGDIEVAETMLGSDSEVDQDKVAQLIAQLADDAKVTSKNVVTSLGASQSYVSVIKTPKVKSEELADSIKFQADKVVPMSIDQVKLDWTIIKDDPQSEQQDVLIVATPNLVAEKYLNLIQKAGFELLALEINAIAQSRSLINIQDNQKCILILDIGSLASDISIMCAQAPVVLRSVSVGYKALKRVAVQNLGIDEAQADQFLKKFGLDQTKVEGQLYKTLKPTIDHLIEELLKSITYFQENNPSSKVEKIILTGGTAALPGLAMYLANTTKLTVEIGNPWQNISYPKDLESNLNSISLNYATAIGLAMREFV